MTTNQFSRTIDSAFEQASSPQLAPIKFIPWQQATITVPSTHELEEDLARIKGKHRKNVADEIRLMFKNFLKNGYFKFDTSLIKFTYGQDFYRNLLKTIQPFTKVIKDARPGECCHRVFLLKGIETTPSECITYSGSDESHRHYHLYPSHNHLTYRTIPADFLTHRHEKWDNYCEINNLPNHIDFDGRTQWGAALLETQRSVLVPITAPRPDDRRGYDESDKEAYMQYVQNRLDNYQAGVCNVAVRKHGRVYTITTGLPIEVRQQMRIDGEKTVEIDLHATYWALLIMMMEDCEEKDILIQTYQTSGFYSIFDFSVLPPGANPKVEVMKQCLFLNSNEAMPPLRQQLRHRFPEFDALIGSLRETHTPTGLSHILTRLEGRVFIDVMIPRIRALGCKPNSNHDGIIVPVSHAEKVWQLMFRTLARFLGFAPKLNIKGAQLKKAKPTDCHTSNTTGQIAI